MIVGGKFQQARLISSVAPNYPNNARNLRIEGSVVVHGTIDVNGQVTNMSVVSGAAVLRPAALEAIRKWKYAPGLLDGKPAPTDVDITVEFRIH
jgi:periplasmic protein TonB